MFRISGVFALCWLCQLNISQEIKAMLIINYNNRKQVRSILGKRKSRRFGIFLPEQPQTVPFFLAIYLFICYIIFSITSLMHSLAISVTKSISSGCIINGGLKYITSPSGLSRTPFFNAFL